MKKFPETIPVFPLSGVIYFPKTNLPLNIFEQDTWIWLMMLIKKINSWEWCNQKRK